VTVAGGVEKDEAEQLLWTQTLAWGYGPQPPLYSWLQWALFQLTGPTVVGLALLKNALLFATYAFTWAAARRLLEPAPAALAAASLLLLPQVAWESQRDLTHTVLVTSAAAATLWLAIGLLQRPGAWRCSGRRPAGSARVLDLGVGGRRQQLPPGTVRSFRAALSLAAPPAADNGASSHFIRGRHGER